MEVGAATTPAADSTAANLLLFVPRADDPLAGGAAHAIDALLDGALGLLVADGELTGKRGQVTVVHTLGRAPMTRLLVAGLGDASAIDLERVRNATATAARRARARADGTLDVAIAGPPLDALDETDLAQAITEGLLLGLYRFDRHLHPKEAPKSISGARILGRDEAALAEGVRRGAILGEATNFCRDLANEPSNLLTPTEMATRAETMGPRHRPRNPSAGGKRRSGARHGLLPRRRQRLPSARQNDHPAPPRRRRRAGLALIGKGITFDTGGISLKPSASMVSMKQDMSGGGAVIAAIGALARLNAPINVTAIVPATENMPGGSAIKPSDVLTAMNGKTIEVLNTDAEGRLVLADALCYANHLGLAPLIDVATLTGAVAVALGTTTTGLMTNDDALGAELIAAGAVSGEKIWQLPMFDDYDDLIKSPIADVKNTGGRYAGAITAAKFLEVFAGDTPWVHLDMAGTDDADKDNGATVRGATGVPVRTLVRWVLDRAAKQKELS